MVIRYLLEKNNLRRLRRPPVAAPNGPVRAAPAAGLPPGAGQTAAAPRRRRSGPRPPPTSGRGPARGRHDASAYGQAAGHFPMTAVRDALQFAECLEAFA